ncbi:MAG: TonB-dependent receptor [Pyrinomonadaceae bacterium]|nr:TonB-dependent receptor [Pyrinomonadaceae bacterium]
MTRNHLLMLLTIFILSLVYIPQPIQAQAVYGSVSGIVTDNSGAVVPGATITITSVERKTVDTVVTNSDGYYQKDRLIPGVYSVKIEKENFKSGIVNELVVNVDTQTKNDIGLETGQVSEVITIEGDSQLLKTDRADVSTIFSTREVAELPILDRNFTKLILLTPGTQQQLWNHAASENPQGSTQTIVNGQTFSGTGYQLDGTDNRDVILGIIVINPTFDSIGETKITSSNYDAEFGQAISGVASVQTKSGTNSFRGSIFEYAQRDRFQARSPFSQAKVNSLTGKFIPATKRDQFGFSIGGPIVKNRLFFFGDYQGTRATQGGSKILTVPTILSRTGNLSEYGTIIRNPSTNTVYAGNIIPACGAGQTAAANGCLSAQALNVLRLFPNPTSPGTINNFAASGSEKFNNDIFNVRIDSRLSERFNLFGRFSRGKFLLNGPTAFGQAGGPELVSLGGNSKSRNISLATGFDYTLSSTSVVDVRFGFFNYKVAVFPFDYQTTPATAAGIPGLNFDDFSSGLFAGFVSVRDSTTGNANSGRGADINFGSGLGVNRCNCPLDQDEKQYQIVTNLTKVTGNHTLKFGVDVRRAFNLRVPSDNHRSGELTFGQDRTGLGLATFLIGDVTSFRRYVSTSVDAKEKQWRHFYYGQDTWRATPKLTVAYGLRADVINPQVINAPGNGGFADLNTGEIVVAGVGGNGLNGNIKNKVNFAPRLGVAYQINDKMVIRGGFGRSYDIGVFGTVFGHTVTQNIPVLAVQNLNASSNTARVFNLSQGPPVPTGFFGITTLPKNCPVGGCILNTAIPSNGRFFIPDGVLVRALTDKQTLPSVDAYNITFQYQFAKNWSLEAAYVGNNGRNVFVGDNPDLNVNQATLVGYGTNGVTPNIPINQRKPFFQKFGWTQDILQYQGYGATNRYNSLQIKVNKRFSTGYSILTHYTRQKSVNNSGEQYSFDKSLNRGTADFNRENIFVLSQLFEVPVGRNRKYFGGISRVADFFIGGWQINSNTTWQSGFPFNVNYEPCRNIPAPTPADPTATARQCDRDTGPNRPNVNGKIKYTPGVNGTIDASAFSKPGIGTFGNLKRNAIAGPSYFRTDASLFKRLNFTERMNLELRLEVVNLFNTVNLGNPDSFLGSFNAAGVLVPNANFGKSDSTAFFGNDPQRNLQFAVRFSF